MVKTEEPPAYPLSNMSGLTVDGKENEKLHMYNRYNKPDTPKNGHIGSDEETEKFLPPVKLDPGWDGMDKKPEELTSLDRTIDEMEKSSPNDRYYIVFLIFLIHGVGILMPWNMFITAQAYFEDYKLAAPESEWEVSDNSTEPVKTEYQKNFINYLGIASQLPNVFLNAVNTFCQCGGKASSRRIAYSIALIVLVFVVTVVLAMLDSSDWRGAFFWITMLSVVLLNSAAGVYQNSVYGTAAILPMKYTNAVVLGNNLCGTFTAVLNIVAIALAPNPRTAAIYYFVCAIVVLLVAFDAYFVLPLTKFYRHFCTIVALKEKASPENQESRTFGETLQLYWQVFRKIWVQILCVWFVFFVSLTAFPGMWARTERVDIPVSDTYFKPVFCFLWFNLFAFLGNVVSEFIKVPGPRWVWIPILLRGLFIPFFLLCNYMPEFRTFPAYFANDYVYIIGAFFLAFTSGYYSSLTMMYGPKLVEPQVAGIAGMLMAFFLVLGIACGVNFSLAMAKLVESPLWGPKIIELPQT